MCVCDHDLSSASHHLPEEFSNSDQIGRTPSTSPGSLAASFLCGFPTGSTTAVRPATRPGTPQPSFCGF